MEQLKNTLGDRGVLLDVPVNDIEAVFRAAVAQCIKNGTLTHELRDSVLDELLSREAQASTAIGHAVAVPHAYIDTITEQIVLFIRTKRPIEMDVPDDVPVRYLFVLLGPPNKAAQHLDTLTAIARLMSDEEFRYDAGESKRAEDFLAAIGRFEQRTAPKPAPEPKEQEELDFPGKLGSGLVGDLRRRWPHYASDFRDGIHSKTISSTLFLYFACMAPAITFGGLMHQATGGLIGATEMLVATAVCGILQALFGAQPLMILGGTGPLLVLTGVIYTLSAQLGMQQYFLPIYAWIGIWTAFFCIVVALTNLSGLIRYFTRFTDEIFAALMSIIFIVEAVKRIFDYVNDAHSDTISHDVGFLSLIVAMGTFIIAMMLSRMRTSRYLLPVGREFLADFGPSIAVVSMMLFANLFSTTRLEALTVPPQFGTTTGRPWIVNLFDAPGWTWIAAAGPALLVTVLVYMDQNITARIVNSGDNRLQKGPAYHLDMLVVGILIGICSIFGFPWLVAATVRSLSHLRSLATVEEVAQPGGETRLDILHVREQRVTGLLIHLLIAASLLLLPWLEYVPQAVLYGMFLFMGIVSFAGNQFFERVLLWPMDPALYPRTHYIRKVPRTSIHLFTLLQVVCLALLWVVKVSAVGILFPLFIALLVPVRLWADKFFKPEHLEALDAESIPKEEEAAEWV